MWRRLALGWVLAVASAVSCAVASAVSCRWDCRAGSPAADNKTACHSLSPDLCTINATVHDHLDADSTTVHLDIQTVLYRTEPPLVPAARSRIAVAAITAGGSNGCDIFSTGPKNCSEQLGLIHLAGRRGADVAVLPEEFLWDPASPPPRDCDMSPTQNCSVINQLGAIAREHSMYIVFGMRAVAPADDPYPADPQRPKPWGKLGYNTDVILGRDGKLVGYYRKAWPCCPGPDGSSMDDGYPSREMAKSWDLDFGRVGLQTCFDMNFDDTWHQLYAANVDIVFWPSAYGGGMPIRGYAQLYHYNIVPVGWGDITDITGNVAEGLEAVVPGKMFMATLDLDRTFTHDDFVANKVQKLLADHQGLVQQLTVPEYCSVEGNCRQTADLVRESGFYLLARTEEGYRQGISVRALLAEYDIESLRQYQHRSRAAINMQRQAASASPALLKRVKGGLTSVDRQCKYDAASARNSTAWGLNSTCEPLSFGASSTVTIDSASAAPLTDVYYADTRVTSYQSPPLPGDPKKSRIKVAAIAGLKCCVGTSDVNASIELGLSKVEAAAKLGATVAVLPEESICGQAECALEVDGPEVARFSALAKQYHMYIILGLRVKAPADDPYPADPARGSVKLGYNTDVILGRDGKLVGYYRKAWPCCPGPDGSSMDDGYPSREMAKSWDLDFGRVGLQTCFDMNFDDTWHQLYAANVDIVFWPSAYGGGMPMRGYAKLYHYAIVPVGWGDITDMTGRVANTTAQEAEGIFTATLDLDNTLFHTNFNDFGPILRDYEGKIERIEVPGYCSKPGNCYKTADLLEESGFVLLARTREGYEAGVSVRALASQYNLTDLRQYQHQARRAINMQRMTAAANTKSWPYTGDTLGGISGDPRQARFDKLASSTGRLYEQAGLEQDKHVPATSFIRAEGSRGWRGTYHLTGWRGSWGRTWWSWWSWICTITLGSV